MKKLMLSFVLACAMVLGFVAVVSADNGPHGSFAASTDACASCHRAHSAAVGSNQLLKVDANALCMACHNGGGAGTNVGSGVYTAGLAPGGGVEGATGASLLGGGFDKALMATAWSGATLPQAGFNAVSRNTTSHHSLNAPGTVYGSGAANDLEATMTLECVSCHDPHGNAGYQMTADAATGKWTASTTKVASYRLLRFQPQGSNGFTAPAASNWSGGAFPAAGSITGWTVPDNRAALNTEWYTIGTTAAFAAGDYNANDATNVYNPSLDGIGRPNYIVDAANIAYFCAQCHDRYFTNSRLRNDQDFSLACGFDVAASGIPAGSVTAKTRPTTAVLTIRNTAASANCVESAMTVARSALVVDFYSDALGTVLTGSVTYPVGATVMVWGDNSASADTVHTYMHTSGDVLRASVDGSFVPAPSASNPNPMTAPTSVGRTCVACHTAHGTAAAMTNLASINTLRQPTGPAATAVDNSVLLRMDNRALCLRCHASGVGYTVAP